MHRKIPVLHRKNNLNGFCRNCKGKILPILNNKDSKEAQYVRKLGRKIPQTYEDYRAFVETRPPEVVANIAICLIHQANYLVDQQLRRLEKDFLRQGGLRERMASARLRAREQQRNGR